YLDYVKREKAAKKEERQLRLARLRPRPRKPCARSDLAESLGAREASHTSMNLMTSVPSTASLRTVTAPMVIEDRTPTPEQCEEPTVGPGSPRLAEPRVRDEIPENVRKLYSKFRGPLMLKYLKELASSDQVTGWRLFEVSRSPEDSTEEALSNDREKELSDWNPGIPAAGPAAPGPEAAAKAHAPGLPGRGRDAQGSSALMVGAQDAKAEGCRLALAIAEPRWQSDLGALECEGCCQDADETVHWYNKHGQLAEQIRLNAAVVHEHLSEIKPSQAMKILYDLDQQAKETLTDPTGWIINQAKLRKQANETKGKGDGKGEKDGDHKGNNKTDGKVEAASKDAVPEWRSQKSEELDEKNNKTGGNKGQQCKADEGEEQETDEFRAKMKRTINWYNRHGGLLAPIRFQEVIQTLGMTDPRVAMRILNDLDQANAEAVLQDPTKWIIEECRRRARALVTPVQVCLKAATPKASKHHPTAVAT
ncbi:unnamed protein product, partial [Symbiodinium necroappetens]